MLIIYIQNTYWLYMLDSEFNKKMEIESTRLNFVYEDIYLSPCIMNYEVEVASINSQTTRETNNFCT